MKTRRSTSAEVHHENRLLAALTADERARLMPHLERVDLLVSQVLHEAGDTIEHVYFPETAAVSLLSSDSSHQTLAVASVGGEGLVGLPVFLGSETARHTAAVLAPGPAVRLESAVLRREREHLRRLYSLALSFANLALAQVAQMALCSRHHTLEARLGRWLLTTSHRTGRDELWVTHARLAELLGGHRPAISNAVASFEQAGILSTSRGRMRILDFGGLELASCACYAAERTEHETYLAELERVRRSASGPVPGARKRGKAAGFQSPAAPPPFHYAVRADEMPWQPHAVAGVSVRKLHLNLVTRQIVALLRCEPGSRFPEYRHASGEEIYVLEGDFSIGGSTFGPGDYLHSLPGSIHPAATTRGGNLLLCRTSIDDEMLG